MLNMSKCISGLGIPQAEMDISRIAACWRIYASVYWVTFGSDNGLSPVRRKAIIPTKVDLLLIQPFVTNISEMASKIKFKKIINEID